MMKLFFFILAAIIVLLFCGYADIAIAEKAEEERKKRAVVRKAAVASRPHPVDFEEFLRSISE